MFRFSDVEGGVQSLGLQGLALRVEGAGCGKQQSCSRLWSSHL